MKKIWKRYLLLLSVLACFFCLTACSNDKDKDTVSYNADTQEYLEQQIKIAKAQGATDISVEDYVDNLAEQAINYIEQYFVNVSRETLKKQVKEDEETFASAASYLEATEDLGNYKKNSAYDMSVEVSDEGMAITGTVSFKERDVKFALNQDESNTINVSFEKELTLGEILKKAGINTLLGMGTVFLVLILISIIIWCLGFVSKIEKPAAVPAAPAPAPIPVPAVEESEEDVTDDTELIAVISAAIAAYEGTSAEGFQVRSIKRVGSVKRRRL